MVNDDDAALFFCVWTGRHGRQQMPCTLLAGYRCLKRDVLCKRQRRRNFFNKMVHSVGHNLFLFLIQ